MLFGQLFLPLTAFTLIISYRGGRGGKGAERQVSADGVYTNHRFMQAVGALVGLPVRVSHCNMMPCLIGAGCDRMRNGMEALMYYN